MVRGILPRVSHRINESLLAPIIVCVCWVFLRILSTAWPYSRCAWCVFVILERGLKCEVHRNLRAKSTLKSENKSKRKRKLGHFTTENLDIHGFLPMHSLHCLQPRNDGAPERTNGRLEHN